MDPKLATETSSLPPGLTPELLEQMRTIGLRLDKAGALWHQETQVSHPRLRQALLRWLDVLEDGRDIIRLDAKRYAYVDVEDAHLRARSARWDGERCRVLWDDEQEEELDYASLTLADDNAFYTTARGGKLRGRIAGAAHHAVAERIVETGETFALAAIGKQWPIEPG
jgi:hypothetical protein